MDKISESSIRTKLKRKLQQNNTHSDLINLAIISNTRLSRQWCSYPTPYPTCFVYIQARKWHHLIAYWLTETIVSSCKKASSPSYTWRLSSTSMELKVQTVATFDDTEIYWTHIYCFYQQFPNVKGFSGFLRMIAHMKTVNTRPLLSSHVAWIRGYVNIYMNTTEMGEDNSKKDY